MPQGQAFLFRTAQPAITSLAKPLTTTRRPVVQHQQAQSLRVVQDHLTVWIGCLSYLRGFFPANCFVKKSYGHSAALPTLSGSRQEVMELVKGVTPEADTLLDILQNSVFKALQDGHLRGLQLGIYIDEQAPDVVVESYTFSFSQQNDGELGLLVTNQAGNLVNSNAIRSAQQLTRTLVMIAQNLHPLPGTYIAH